MCISCIEFLNIDGDVPDLQIPGVVVEHFGEWVLKDVNVSGDGNCGFRLANE